MLNLAKALRLLPLNDWLWLALGAALIGYHVYAVEAAKLGERRAVTTQYEAKISQANADAKADHDAMQGKLDAQAGPSNAQLQSQFDAIQKNLRALGVAGATGKALPKGCQYAQQDVDATNAELAK